jgi:DNA-binding SARP family transcriptional activator
MLGLEIRLFGVGEVRHTSSARAAILAPSVRALFGYLVLNRNHPHHRDLLATVFWPDTDDRCARNRLSTALWRLRKVLEPDDVPTGSYLIADRDGAVRFNHHSDYWLDVAEFEQAAARLLSADGGLELDEMTAFERAASVFDNDLLEGADEPWLVLERERLARLYLSATERCMQRYGALGESDRAIAAGRRILDREPLREHTHRSLIRLYARSGQRCEAIRQYDRCRQLLQDELGVLPLPETTAAAACVGQTAWGGSDPPIGQAIDLIERLSRSLGVVVNELDQIARALQSADDVR